ncbi:ubiquitin carboxyl-terminal hydrolase 4 [Limosa lapponica baueri]|uniref:Ubiquitin carboxyl-terminal hydrolase 4 n=1 Tax=Limosa lapponica baueri TaxID=1758121 RepID=A0A2I0UP74_LIMLA|nr:ubiquitin carboxyl-terminal hydrolase 4 [Limosa lapponica baueri]
MEERYPLKEDLVNYQGKWTNSESGIQYLRELAVVEEIYRSLDSNQAPKDPDEVHCMWSMWWEFLWSTPSSYTSTLALMSWAGIKAPTVGRLARQLQQFKENLSSTPTLQACVSAGERLSQQLLLFKDSMSSSSPKAAIISAVLCSRGKALWAHFHATLSFCLHDHKEDMRRWDGEPTSSLEAGVCEL